MNKKFKSELLEWIKPIGLSVVIALGLTLVIQPARVEGSSMYPTLENNDCLIVNKLSYGENIPNRGDIIVFNSDLIDSKTGKKQDLVKRVIALPGEHLVINNNEVYINNEKLDETYIDNVYTDGNIDMIVPDNHVFAMGDNRENSDDSRKSYIGPIHLDKIIGKVSFRTFPFYKLGDVE